MENYGNIFIIRGKASYRQVVYQWKGIGPVYFTGFSYDYEPRSAFFSGSIHIKHLFLLLESQFLLVKSHDITNKSPINPQ